MNNVDKDQNLKSSEIENTLFIHFRCPSCSKLYSSNPENIYVENPEYSCSSCQTEFSISLIQALESPEVVGVEKMVVEPAETVELPVQNQDKGQGRLVPENKASKVVEDLVAEFKEQPKSRVGFEDLNEINHANSLELLWQRVLSSYEDRKTHSAFIKFCKTEGKLDFALQMYGKILKNNPNDRIASSFVAKMQVSTEVEGFVESEKNHKILTRSFYITLLIVCTGLSFILLGLVLGENKNLAGLGIALIFFTFAVKAFFQPRRSVVD